MRLNLCLFFLFLALNIRPQFVFAQKTSSASFKSSKKSSSSKSSSSKSSSSPQFKIDGYDPPTAIIGPHESMDEYYERLRKEKIREEKNREIEFEEEQEVDFLEDYREKALIDHKKLVNKLRKKRGEPLLEEDVSQSDEKNQDKKED